MALESGLLLDTHTWIWLRFGLLTAPPQTMQVIRRAADTGDWFVGAFSFYEIAHAVQRKRLQLEMPLLDWLRSSSGYGMPTILPVTPEIAAATLDLPETFHGDPGDRLLAATAIKHGLTLCTHDDQLLRYSKHGLYRALKVSELKPRSAL